MQRTFLLVVGALLVLVVAPLALVLLKAPPTAASSSGCHGELGCGMNLTFDLTNLWIAAGLGLAGLASLVGAIFVRDPEPDAD